MRFCFVSTNHNPCEGSENALEEKPPKLTGMVETLGAELIHAIAKRPKLFGRSLDRRFGTT